MPLIWGHFYFIIVLFSIIYHSLKIKNLLLAFADFVGIELCGIEKNIKKEINNVYYRF